MLAEKYEPKSLNGLIGNNSQARDILSWLKAWKKGGMIIYGPPGCGKTLAVRLAAKELGWEVVKRHASDPAGTVSSVLEASRQKSMFSKGKIFLIDDAEQTDSVRHITELIRNSKFPVVLISGGYERKLAPVLSLCTAVKFQKLRYDQIENFLRKVCEAEKLRCEEKAVAHLARSCNGDIRAALIDMETISPAITLEAAKSISHREKEDSIFETVRLILKATSIESARLAVQNSGEPEQAVAWLQENIANEYEDAEEIAAAYDWLSKADIFRSRIIRRQSWALQKYVQDLAVFGAALSKNRPYAKFVRYSFPRRPWIKADKELEPFARELHVSVRRLRLYSQLLKTEG